MPRVQSLEHKEHKEHKVSRVLREQIALFKEIQEERVLRAHRVPRG